MFTDLATDLILILTATRLALVILLLCRRIRPR